MFLSKTVAALLVNWKKEQDFIIKDALGSEYQDYNLVMVGPVGFPIESSAIEASFNRLIEENELPKVVFHSLRHSSITYKLKLNGGDIKAVQGDTGHARASMITERYAHILDDDRRINAEKFEEMFYQDKENSFHSQDTEQLLKIAKKLQESPELLTLLNKISE